LRTALRSILITLLAVGLVALFLRNADLARVWTAMRTARLDLMAVAVLLTLVTYIVRAERWQYLLEPLGHTRFWVAFRTTVIGFAASAVLPARAGGVLRPYLLARQEGLSATAAFATIVLERVLDLVAVLLLLAVYLLWFDPGMAARDSALFSAIRIGGLISTPVALAALGLMFYMAGHPASLQSLIARVETILPARAAAATIKLARMFAEGFAVVRRPERLLAGLTWSVVLWLVIAAETWVVALAVGIAMPFTGTLLLLLMLVVGVAVPTPGGVGGFHEAFRLGVTAFFAADNDAAIGAAILLHAASFVPVCAMGAWFAFRGGMNLRGLRRMARASEAEARA
jgi:uncharacterized protein (TIRG00374 family)